MTVENTANAITRDGLVAELAKIVGRPADEIPDRENLVLLGLDSLDLMNLVNGWRRQGIPVSFSDLVAEPTVENLWKHISEQLRHHPLLPAGK